MVANKVPGVRAALCHDLSSRPQQPRAQPRQRPHAGRALHRRGPGHRDRAGLAGDGLGARPPRRPGGQDHRRRASLHERQPVRVEQDDRDDATSANDLVEAITREVLAASAARGRAPGRPSAADPCASCVRGCAAQCATKVRDIVAGGATRVEYHGRADDVPGDLARYIDHTLLEPDATRPPTSTGSARRPPSTASPPSASTRPGSAARPRTCAARTSPSPRSSASRSAPSTTEVKACEARRAIRDGAREIDMVINIGALKSGMHDAVREDIARVVGRLPRGRRGQQGDHRDRAPHRRGEGHRLPPRAAGEGRLRQDLDRLREGRRHRLRRRADARGGRPEDGRQGGRRHPDRRGRAGHDRGRARPGSGPRPASRSSRERRARMGNY